MCVFCKIVEGSIPSYKVYEDETCLAFLDINPVSKGHLIVIPKHHCEHVLDCNDEVYAHVMLITKKLANHVMKTMEADGLHLLTNSGESAGQSVQHFHFHIVPRYASGDGVELTFTKQEGLDMLQIQHTLKVENSYE